MSVELLNAYPFTSTYGTHTPNYWTKYNSNGEAYFDTNGTSAGTEYIPINPTGKTFYWDLIISVNAGNQFYIGFERYDKDFTPRSNNACVYVYATRPSADVVYQRYKGTVDLSTDGVNPCAFVTVRILNGWGGTTSGVTGTATIHYLSLRAVGTSTGFTPFKVYKTGIVQADTIIDKNDKMSIEKVGVLNGTDFIEI